MIIRIYTLKRRIERARFIIFCTIILDAKMYSFDLTSEL